MASMDEDRSPSAQVSHLVSGRICRWLNQWVSPSHCNLVDLHQTLLFYFPRPGLKTRRLPQFLTTLAEWTRAPLDQ